MKTTVFGSLICLIACLSMPAVADNVIKVRVSMKVITDEQGNPPQGVVIPRLQVVLDSDLRRIPPLLGRGYEVERFRCKFLEWSGCAFALGTVILRGSRIAGRESFPFVRTVFFGSYGRPQCPAGWPLPSERLGTLSSAV